MQRPLATRHASLKLHWKGWAVISREGFLIREHPSPAPRGPANGAVAGTAMIVASP